MKMKRFTAPVVALLVMVCLVCASQPAPPVFRGAVAPTNGFWMTNITFVFTNVAVVKPGAVFPQVTIFSTNTLSAGNPLAWVPNPDPTVAYRLFYGQVSSTVTNVLNVNSNVNAVTFYNTLTNGVPYWAYVVCYDTNGNTSPPSGTITFTPH